MISSSAPAAAIPPHDLEAEDSVLGAVLLDKTAISKVVDILTPEDFYRENNGQIYKAALNLNQRGEPIDHITLSAELEKRGILERVGGRAHLALLHEQTPTAANVEHYARIVKDLATKRRLIVAGQEIVRLGHDDQLESAEVIELSSRLQERASVGNIPSWEPPIPLDMLCQLPEFPAYVLPPWLVSFISALAESTQTPIDLAGMLALDVLSTAAGGRVQLRINSDWSEPLNLYTAVALSPGERKSSVFRAMTKPLLEFEKQMVVEKSYELSQARARRRVREKALEAAQNAAARAEGMEQEKLLERVDIAALELQDAIVPAEFRLIADDATPESLATLIADQRGKMAVLSPEGGIFGQMAGRYGNQPNLDVYLKGHAGDLLKVDRKGRPSEYIEEPALTVGLTVQPEVIRAMAVQPGFEGKGLPARFLYSMPVSRVGSRKIEVAPVPEQVAQEYASELKLLARNLEQLPQLYILTVSKRAQAMLDDFRRELEPKLGDDGELGHIRYWGCKLAGAIARISALLHLGRNIRGQWGGQVELEEMEGALAIGDYLLPHALTAFDLMEADPNLTLARRILKWIEEQGMKSFFRRDCHYIFKSRISKVEELDPALQVLMNHGFLARRQPMERSGRGRPAGPIFEVNPRGQKPRNPQKT